MCSFIRHKKKGNISFKRREIKLQNKNLNRLDEERHVCVPNVSFWCPGSMFLEILRHQLELSGRPDVWCDFSSASRCPPPLLFPIERYNHRLNWINRRYIFEAVRLLFSFVAANKVEYQKCRGGDLLSVVRVFKLFMIFQHTHEPHQNQDYDKWICYFLLVWQWDNSHIKMRLYRIRYRGEFHVLFHVLH